MKNEWLERAGLRRDNDELRAEVERLKNENQQLRQQIGDGEKTAENGYAQAYQIITELRNRLETQKEEFEKALNEGYEEAYQMLLAERNKVNLLEVEMYEQYDKKVQDIKEYMVDKLDQFLDLKAAEIREMGHEEWSERMNAWRTTVGARAILDEAIGAPPELDNTEQFRAQIRIQEAKLMRRAVELAKTQEKLKAAENLVADANKRLEMAGLPEKPIMQTAMVGLLKDMVDNLKNTPTDPDVITVDYEVRK